MPSAEDMINKCFRHQHPEQVKNPPHASPESIQLAQAELRSGSGQPYRWGVIEPEPDPAPPLGIGGVALALLLFALSWLPVIITWWML